MISIWIVALMSMAFVYAGYLIGRIEKKKDIVGTLIIDKVNPEFNGGIYTVWDIDPHQLKDGEVIRMDVLLATMNTWKKMGYPVNQNSQESQG